jgi:hypothetical protein
MRFSGSLAAAGVVLVLLLLATLYVGGYFAFSYAHSGPGERYFAEGWLLDLYSPAVRVEEWVTGREVKFGFVEYLPEENIPET